MTSGRSTATHEELPQPETRYAVARDGARLAYQEIGSGPPTVVAIPPMAQNIEMAWDWPGLRRMYRRFGSFSRWVHFDKRGTGCSDRRSHLPGIDERVDDLRAVMDAAGVERAHLFGQSEGGPAALLFAATYPDRVESVTIFGSGARSTPELEGDELVELKARAAWLGQVWGTSESPIIDRFAPTMASDEEFRDWHLRYERFSADGQSIRELIEISIDVDVSEVLDQISVPTLVIHRVDDLIVPVELGRAAAARIAGAKLVELPGIDHWGHVGDVDAWIDELERFVSGSVATSVQAAPSPSSKPRIVTLGRFAVVRGLADGGSAEVEVAEWGSRLPRILCKRLAAAQGWPVPREELFELLWPGESDAGKLGARLSVHLSAVRRVLGGGVRATRETVALDLDEVTIDLVDLIQAGDDEGVVDAYAGEFLPEDRAEDWSTGARDEARARFAVAARRLAESAIGHRDFERAASLGRRLVEADRFDDAAHRLLIGALLSGDRASEAMVAHRRWAEAMAELDIEVESIDSLTADWPDSTP